MKANTVVSIATKRKAILPNDNKHKRVRKNANNKAYKERKEERLITTALRIETTTDEQANTAVLIATSERVAEVSGEQLLCNSHAQPVKRNDFATWIDYKRDASYHRMWQNAVDRFHHVFYGIRFDASCSVCDRLWPDSSLRYVTQACHDTLREAFPREDVVKFQVCNNCSHMLRKGRIPNMSRSNGFKYPPKPTHLPPLDPVGLRLVSPRLPFMQIRRLQLEGGYGIV